MLEQFELAADARWWIHFLWGVPLLFILHLWSQSARGRTLNIFGYDPQRSKLWLSSLGRRRWARAVVLAIAMMFLTAATARISGGHINPAVTFATLITGKIDIQKAIAYWIAQLLGAVVGAGLLAMVIPTAAQGNLGAHGLGAGVSAGGGLVAEIVLTFALVFVIFATAVDPKGPGHLAPLAIGFTVLVDHLVGVPVTGASMNPARSFGPALVAGAWADHWIFWIGPLVGAAIAGWVYQGVFAEEAR